MIIRLFSVFDPVAILGISLNWLSLIVVVFLIPSGWFVIMGGVERVYKVILRLVGKVYREVSYPNFLGLVTLRIAILVYLSIENMIGLFPFVFTGTRHLVVTFSLGLMIWFRSILIGWTKLLKRRLAHLVPEGSPMVLRSFMVIIEFIRQVIRPVTLSVRLAANMMAGHLIIGLIASVRTFSLSGILMSVFLQTFILVLEVAVAVIQAFVFRILVILYCLEYY